MPTPQAAMPVASMANMVNVFQIFESMFGATLPVPFD